MDVATLPTVKIVVKDHPETSCTLDYIMLSAMSRLYQDVDRLDRSTSPKHEGYFKYAPVMTIDLLKTPTQDALDAVSKVLTALFHRKKNDVRVEIEKILRSMEPKDRSSCMCVLDWLNLVETSQTKLSKLLLSIDDDVLATILDPNLNDFNIRYDTDIWFGPTKMDSEKATAASKAAMSDVATAADVPHALVGRNVIKVIKSIQHAFLVSKADGERLRESLMNHIMKKSRSICGAGEMAVPIVERLANFVARNVEFLLPTYQDAVRYCYDLKAAGLVKHAHNLMLHAMRGLGSQAEGAAARFTPRIYCDHGSIVGSFHVDDLNPDRVQVIYTGPHVPIN